MKKTKGVYGESREVSAEEYRTIIEKLRNAPDGDLMTVKRLRSQDPNVIEMRAWLDSLPSVKDDDTKPEVFTIEQRLNWLCDPSISLDRRLHLFYLCKSLRLTIMMRHVLPTSWHAEIMEMGRKPGTVGEPRRLIRHWLKKCPWWEKMAVISAFENERGWRVDWLKQKVIRPEGKAVKFRTIGNIVSLEKKNKKA